MTKNEQRQLELFSQLGEIAEELGWVIAIPTFEGQSDSDIVTGLILGTEDFVFTIANEVNGGENMEVYEKTDDSTAKKSDTGDNNGGSGSGPTFH